MSGIDTNKNKKQKAGVVFPATQSSISLSPEARLEEACGLALAINLDIVYQDCFKIREIKAGSFLGQGIIEQLEATIKEKEIDVLIIDAELSPIQQRNLEKALQTKVIDRTALILEIFGERAHTKEGSLQVELAHLTYQRSRLVRSWTHLERQRGGAGFLGGPGETQIELDRRIIDDKIIRIKKDLEKVKKTRDLQRSARQRVPYPVVALVGYTNAGKSSLFNHLTNAGVFAKDLLFATLDPTMRKIRLKSGREIILSDTVGFISDLPHELIMSFRATLEEVLSADVVVHIRDISNANNIEQKKDVINVLKNLGLTDIEDSSNYVEVLNKIDILSDVDKNYAKSCSSRVENVVCTSALSGEGIDEFLALIDKKLAAKHLLAKVKLGCDDGKLLSWIYANSEVVSCIHRNEKLTLTIKIDALNLNKLQDKSSPVVKVELVTN